MKKLMAGLFLGLYATTAFAENWLLIAWDGHNPEVKYYGGEESVDFDKAKGWIKSVNTGKNVDYTLALVEADCSARRIALHSEYFYYKNGRKKYVPHNPPLWADVAPETVGVGTLNWLCDGKYYYNQ